MIAANYRKHPEAAALQLPLPFPHRLVWALPRPGARVLRAIRVARGKAFAAAGRIAYPIKPATPQWWKDAKRKAKGLAQQVREACMVVFAEILVSEHTGTADTGKWHQITRLLGFNYADDLQRQAEADAKDRKTHKVCMNCDKRTPQIGHPARGWRCLVCSCRNGAYDVDEDDGLAWPA